jgi:hypothetical protein
VKDQQRAAKRKNAGAGERKPKAAAVIVCHGKLQMLEKDLDAPVIDAGLVSILRGLFWRDATD